ncbi:ABC transporter permease [Betaproteobacteria bacterium PRO7]|nr:ABC transporter permease [Betaproteobacteria bacterium PRO7]
MTLPFALVPRAAPSQVAVWLSPLVALAATVACGMLLFGLLGRSPWQAVAVFFVEPLVSLRGWGEVGLKATPLVLCAVGLALCFRANVWNIGAEGQLIAGAIAGGGVALLATKDSGGALVGAVILAAAAGGMAWAALTAWLRDRFHANEILVSLMLVYVAQLLLSHLVHGPWKDPAGFGFPQSQLFERAARMPILFAGTRLHLGFALALIAAAAAWLLLARGFIGFQLRVAGLAPQAAHYAGFSERRILWTALLASGALAGIAGGAEAAGPVGQLTPSISPGYGFAAIIVAFVGRLHPLGIVGAAFVMALFYIGGELAQSRLGLPSSLTGVYQGLLLLFLLACDTFVHHRLRWRRAAAVG